MIHPSSLSSPVIQSLNLEDPAHMALYASTTIERAGVFYYPPSAKHEKRVALCGKDAHFNAKWEPVANRVVSEQQACLLGVPLVLLQCIVPAKYRRGTQLNIAYKLLQRLLNIQCRSDRLNGRIMWIRQGDGLVEGVKNFCDNNKYRRCLEYHNEIQVARGQGAGGGLTAMFAALQATATELHRTYPHLLAVAMGGEAVNRLLLYATDLLQDRLAVSDPYHFNVLRMLGIVPGIFDPNQRRWVEYDPVTHAALLSAVDKCFSDTELQDAIQAHNFVQAHGQALDATIHTLQEAKRKLDRHFECCILSHPSFDAVAPVVYRKWLQQHGRLAGMGDVHVGRDVLRALCSSVFIEQNGHHLLDEPISIPSSMSSIRGSRRAKKVKVEPGLVEVDEDATEDDEDA
jgi:hypothetical protein